MNAPDDAALPGIALALDGKRLLGRLTDLLPECADEIELLRIRVMDVSYKPGVQCLLHYRVKLQDRATGHSAWQVLSARVLRDDEPEPQLDGALRTRYAERRGDISLRTPVVFVRDQRIALWAFPLDPGLPGLFDALDQTTMKRALGRAWRGDVRVEKLDIDLLGYTPQARATFRYQALATDPSTRVPEVRRLIGKMHAYKKAARLFATSWAIWRASRGKIGLAPPVGYLGGLGLTLQEEVRGERLGALTGKKTLPRILRTVAIDLARLHRLDVPLKNVRTPADEARVVRRWGGALGGVHASLADRVAKLREHLAVEVERHARVTGPIHGDFHHTNILVDGDRVTFIDLDETCMGDPCLDVGRFLASLRVPAMRDLGDIDGLRAARATFLETYLRRTGADERRVRLFEASSLLVSAYSAFRVQRPGWSDQAEQLVDEAERVAAEAGRAATAVVVPEPSDEPSPSEARLAWATDGVYMQATLDHHIGKVFGAELTGCRPARGHASNHGQRLRYALTGQRDGERWRATVSGTLRNRRGGRGLLRRIGAVRTAMADAGVSFALPRPVGYLPALLMPIVEAAAGKRLATLIGHPDGLRAAEAIGHGLAAMHRTAVELGKPHRIGEELDALRAQKKSLRAPHPELAARLEMIIDDLERQLSDMPPRIGPVLRTLTPHNLLWNGDAVAVSEVHGLTLAPALIDVGSLVARLVSFGEKSDKERATAAIIARLCSSYGERTGATPDELRFFVTVALARLAGGIADRADAGYLPRRLLERATADVLRPPDTDPPRPAGAAAATSSDRRALAALHAAIGARCRGRCAVFGPSTADLLDDLRAAGLDATAIDIDAPPDDRTYATVIVADLLHRLEPERARTVLEQAASRLDEDGRLIVFLPSRRSSRTGAVRKIDRRRLKRELRPFGSPHLTRDQPYRWLMMTVDRRQTDGGPRGRVQRERFRVTLDLCRGRILELGCSDGAVTRALHDRGHDATGLDLNAKKVELARERHPGIRFIHACAGDPVLADERFDTVLLAEILEHVDEATGDRILDQALRMLTPGGRLVVSVPNEGCIPHPGHIREFDERCLRAALATRGKVRVVTEQPYKWLMMVVERGR